jgi:hypothetical protein
MHQQAFEKAVRSYWGIHQAQAAKQAAEGKADAGLRGAVTGGAHLNAVGDVVAQVFLNAGFTEESIPRRSNIELPGYYRPTKKWDLVVVDKRHLVAAIELKSQVGPSFGNNVNNRAEEAIGSAVDVWRAYREGTFGRVRPWLGYLFGSTRPVGLARTRSRLSRSLKGHRTRTVTVSSASASCVSDSTMLPVLLCRLKNPAPQLGNLPPS